MKESLRKLMGNISIHAPPRGATASLSARHHATCNFNSRPSARGDAGCITVVADNSNFNSRPSARGDVNQFVVVLAKVIFQFTPLREGRLQKISKKCDLPLISIHAPPRGATAADGQGERKGQNFNSRPSARGDGWSPGTLPTWYFNSRPSARGDKSYSAFNAYQLDFNSRPSARGDVYGIND